MVLLIYWKFILLKKINKYITINKTIKDSNNILFYKTFVFLFITEFLYSLWSTHYLDFNINFRLEIIITRRQFVLFLSLLLVTASCSSLFFMMSMLMVAGLMLSGIHEYIPAVSFPTWLIKQFNWLILIFFI